MALLVLCLPLAVATTYGAVVGWVDVLTAPDLPAWQRSDATSVEGAVVATVIGLGTSVLTVLSLTWLVRMLVLGWEGPTWRRSDG